MDQTLRQLGELLLNAVPTVLLVIALFWLYRLILGRPLEATLEQRYALTEGAIEQAKQDIARADARTAEYEQRLREARAALFKAMEARRQQAAQIRAQAAAEARRVADERIRAARHQLEQDAIAARATLQQQAERLASEIINVVLGAAGPAPRPAGGQG